MRAVEVKHVADSFRNAWNRRSKHPSAVTLRAAGADEYMVRAMSQPAGRAIRGERPRICWPSKTIPACHRLPLMVLAPALCLFRKLSVATQKRLQKLQRRLRSTLPNAAAAPCRIRCAPALFAVAATPNHGLAAVAQDRAGRTGGALRRFSLRSPVQVRLRYGVLHAAQRHHARWITKLAETLPVDPAAVRRSRVAKGIKSP